MLASGPIIDDDPDVFFYFIIAVCLLKESLYGHFCISFIHYFLCNRSRIKNERDTFFSKCGITVQLSLKLYPILFGKIHIAEDQKWLLFSSFQIIKSIFRPGKPNSRIRNFQFLQYFYKK